jgi:flagellar biosynthesis/type III secretory pathway M-ring protein FliF/YscJ
MNTLKAMWADLSPKGKAVMVIAVALVIVAAMAFGYALDWLPAWLMG